MASLGVLLQTPKHYTETDKPSPGTLLRVHQGTDCTETASLPLGPFSGYTRGQTTQRQTSLRSPGALLRVNQGTDYTETDKPSLGLFS